MKIPGKSPLKTITKKLPSLSAQQAQNLDSIVSSIIFLFSLSSLLFTEVVINKSINHND